MSYYFVKFSFVTNNSLWCRILVELNILDRNNLSIRKLKTRIELLHSGLIGNVPYVLPSATLPTNSDLLHYNIHVWFVTFEQYESKLLHRIITLEQRGKISSSTWFRVPGYTICSTLSNLKSAVTIMMKLWEKLYHRSTSSFTRTGSTCLLNWQPFLTQVLAALKEST